MICKGDATQKTTSNNLPDKSENEMLATFGEICRTDVDDAASDGFGGRDDNVIVFCDLESIERFPCLGNVEYAGIDRIRNGVVDQFAKYQSI